MGRKGKAEENGLVELIISKHDGGKNTIVYVTKEVNDWLSEQGLQVRFSRESIRRVLKTHEEEIADAKKSIEAAKAMAEILRDNPGTEAAEATLMAMSGLIAKEIRSVESLEFESPVDMANSLVRVSEAQLKMSNSRMKAIAAFDKAKKQLKAELQNAIQNDADLLGRLCAIIDKAAMK